MTIEEKIKTKQMYAEILTEKNTVLSGRTLVKQVGMVLFVDDVLEILKEAQQVSIEPEIMQKCDHIIGLIQFDDGCELIRVSDIKSVADKNRCDKFMENLNFCADCGKAFPA